MKQPPPGVRWGGEHGAAGAGEASGASCRRAGRGPAAPGSLRARKAGPETAFRPPQSASSMIVVDLGRRRPKATTIMRQPSPWERRGAAAGWTWLIPEDPGQRWPVILRDHETAP